MSKFKCPFCTSRITLVKETRPIKPFTRYRKCPKCEKRFTTIEVHIQSDSEDYLNLVSKMSTEKLLERFMKVLATKPAQRVLNEQLQKLAGLRQGKVVRPSDMFN